jgi:ABC-type transport system involved in multi-copper enzyme maturation permease subunit
MTVLALALDVLHEARSRRWTLALAAISTALLLALGLGLRLEVVDGALAAARLFGGDLHSEVRSVDVALRPLFVGTAYVVFYGGLIFGTVATADIAPALLAPGRIEHLLALPVHRWHVLAGLGLGVLALVLAGAAYCGMGVTLILWLKTGVFNPGPMLAALAAAVGFAAVYAAMLGVSVATRSPALAAGAGLGLVFAGILAGHRLPLAQLFHQGLSRTVFLGVTALLPRLSSLGELAVGAASGRAAAVGPAVALIAGTVAFALGLLALAVWRFERKDY